MIIVDLAAATICFLGSCYPALIGPNTPSGEFTITKRYTQQPGYGGDVLQFHETDSTVYAIHRPWLLNPKQRRLDRLNSDRSEDRLITKGCINVNVAVYDKLMQCCTGEKLTIVKGSK